MRKKVFYTELSYLLGVFVLAFGTALMEKADFGVSMVVAPAYIIYAKISQYLSFFTFGMAEYLFQGLLLVAMMLILRKFRFTYLLSFVTVLFYGVILDLCMIGTALITDIGIVLRIVFYVFGMLSCSMGVSLLFHTYLSQAVYELFVKEVSQKFKFNINRFKTIYDCVSCVVAIALSFILFGFGHFEGVGIGTIICALLNGLCIGMFSKLFEKFFEFRDGLKLKKYFA